MISEMVEINGREVEVYVYENGNALSLGTNVDGVNTWRVVVDPLNGTSLADGEGDAARLHALLGKQLRQMRFYFAGGGFIVGTGTMFLALDLIGALK